MRIHESTVMRRLAARLDPREEHVHIPSPQEGLSLFLRYLPPAGAEPVLSRRHFDEWGERHLDIDPESRSRAPASVKVPSGAFQDIFDAWAGELAYDPSLVRAPVAIIRGNGMVTAPMRTPAGCSMPSRHRRQSATSRSAAAPT